MRATKVSISRNKMRERYVSERIEVEIELNEGEKVAEAVTRGRATLRQMFGETPTVEDVAVAKQIIAESEEETL